jgi:hypothetical protein
MIKLFKKKDSKKEDNSSNIDLPPLPENLDQNQDSNNNLENNDNNSLNENANLNTSNTNSSYQENNLLTRNTHDEIPNDIQLNNNQSFSPDNLPNYEEEISDKDLERKNIEDSQNDFQNNSESQDDSELPPLPSINSNSDNLPDIPEIESKSEEGIDNNFNQPNSNNENLKNKTNYEQSEPTPEIDDEVPAPPAIFSKEGLADTSEEIKDLVKNKKNIDLFEPSNETTDDYKMERIEIPREEIEEQNKSMLKSEDIENSFNSENNNSDYLNEDYLKEKYSIKEDIQKTTLSGPIFVDINSFKTMLNGVDIIKEDIRSSDEILQNLNKIKDMKDKELERWRLQLEDIQRKISYVDKVIFNEA